MRSLRRGFRRLSFVLWLFGAAMILAFTSEPMTRPLDDVCTADEDPVYADCLTDAAREAAGANLGRRLLARIDGTWEQVDTERSVARWRTDRYRAALWTFAQRQGLWALGVWGLYYLFLWVASGFREAGD